MPKEEELSKPMLKPHPLVRYLLNVDVRKHNEPAPLPNDPKTAYAYVDRGEDSQLSYDWNGNYDMSPLGAHLTDVEVAGAVRMLMSGDCPVPVLNHEMVVCMARDRIMALSKEVARLTALL
ncbi:hypothetical protein [Mesorhizobium sp.]|uniref:hypothetical protein n=1 Tax=Mesorhizobium sp. TaxID=1871066 RepID=UPI00121D72F5|nr:hypothetical protein [Mesorhizobium sp.]TIX28847.1 MAG: hypothetical protein E5V35_00365 [Mesorhizobium sp.]